MLGFATALSSVGIEAQMGGSAFSKALIKMEVATSSNTKKAKQALEDFAKVCGMSADGFKQLFDTDPAAAFQAFIVGLANLDENGESAIATLDEIGISEVRLRDTMLRAVNATELFDRAQTMATKAWKENTALTVEAGKRYATTASKLTNLKNKAMLLGQTFGNDMMPTVQQLIAGADEYIDKLMQMDASERQAILQKGLLVAAIGPALTIFGKLSIGVGKVSTTLGKFATAVGKAGGGWSGFVKTLAGSPAVWAAITVAVIAGTAAIYDYISGAKQAREALEGMRKTAENWKNTAANTFYGSSQGLSFFGLSTSDFAPNAEMEGAVKSTSSWFNQVVDVWSDGEKETNDIVNQWVSSYKKDTDAVREAIKGEKATADKGMMPQLNTDLKHLDELDKRISEFLNKHRNQQLNEDDLKYLQAWWTNATILPCGTV